MAAETVVTGEVTAFDEERGLGEVVDGDGRRLGFHCAVLADRSRQVDVGATVAFRVVAGRNGRWEATAIEKLA